eukprot:scaffold1823_cov150-Skeletonema_dohrnii-CCMP3373.AAC.1
MSLNQSSSAATKVVKQLANKIINSSKKPEIRSLFVELTQTLNTTSEAHYVSALKKSQLNVTQTKRFPIVQDAFYQILKDANEYEDDSNQQHHKRQMEKDRENRHSSSDVNDEDEVQKPKLSTSNATYGETPPKTISSLLNLLSNHHDGGRTTFPGDFVDAGSGRGGVLCVAALEGMFEKCRGIEYDKRHSQAAFALETEYNKYKQQQLVNSSTTKEETKDNDPIQESHDYGTTASCVQYICGDLGDESFEGASVVYSNAVVFDSPLCSTLGRILDDANLQPNAFVVTATKQFALPSFELVDMLQLPCNGGQLFTFYINQKRTSIVGSDSPKSNSERGAVPAVSDSEYMRRLRSTHAASEREGSSTSSNMMEQLVAISLQDGGLAGLAFLAALGASETNVRYMCDNHGLLSSLVSKLQLEDGHDLPTRASASILLRAMSAFPIGRRTIAQDDRLLDVMFSSLVVVDQLAKNDHVLIRANIVDSLGEVLKDHVGNDVLANRGIDSVVAKLVDDTPSSEMMTEACQAVISFRRWRSGAPNVLWSETLEREFLSL